ncbi:T9SS type A sorting domain-containing protein [Flavobacterium tegetincola]|uniref:T9SS type A sorting domain-containing protein n=1 Tax=Flavobacterium tegetincola TaxID=150172 RepID=UPI00042A63CB|nr:T9SS type A sorting domain-containing protein [Flavobacterium tegetincola]
MKKKLLYTLLFLATLSVQAQTWQWAKRGGSVLPPPNGNEKVVSMCVDPNGNVTVASLVSSSNINIDGNLKTGYSVQYPSSDIAIASFSCDGTYRWSKTIGGYNTDKIQDVGTDAEGNVYAAGTITVGVTDFGTTTTAYQAHFDTDTILPAALQSVNQYKKSMFLIKYDSIGTFKWLRMPQPDDVTNVTSISQNSSKNLQVDGLGNSYWYVYLSPGVYANGNYTVTSPGVTHHILKYDSEGNFVSGLPIDIVTTGYNDFRFTRNHINGNYYIVGGFSSLAEEGTITIGGQLMAHSKYLAAFDSTGAFLWTRTNNGNTPWEVQDFDVTFDANNDLYLTGTTLYSSPLEGPNVIDGWNGQQFVVPANNSGTFMYVVKMDTMGNTIWQTNSSSVGNAKGIAINGNEVAITGYSHSFIWQGINFIYPNNGGDGQYPFIIRFNKNTGAIIANHYLTANSVSSDYGQRILSDNVGNYLIGGSFQSTMSGFGGSITNVGGSDDFFVAKFGSASCDFLGATVFDKKATILYPNPVLNHLFINTQEVQKYQVYSILGSKISEGVLSVGSSIDCSNLTSGVYLLNLINNNGLSTTMKFVKQ